MNDPAIRAPNEVDKLIGNRMRLRRREIGMSQQQLAELSEISFQQIQKYENGTNRTSASRLVQLSRILGVPVGWFFEAPEFDNSHAGYTASVWTDTVAKLSSLTGGLELANGLIELSPAQVVIVTKLVAELTKGAKRRAAA